MLMTMLVAAAVAQAGTPAAAVATAPARPLSALPNTTINYLDVAGRNMKAIAKSLDAVSADPVTKAKRKLYTWNVGAQVLKRTEGQKCTIQKATATLTSTVNLPRLAEAAKTPKEILAQWQSYVTGLENDAATSLWFVNDQLRGVEQSMVGIDCSKSSETWNAAMTRVGTRLAEYNASRAAPATAAVATKPKS